MRTVYAIQFGVDPAVTGDVSSAKTLVNSLVDHAESWIARKYQRDWGLHVQLALDGESKSPREKHAFRGERAVLGDQELVTIDWKHPHEDRDDPARSDDTVLWHTVVTIARVGADVEFSLVIRLSSLGFVVKPVAFTIGRPRLVEDLVTTLSCSIRSERIEVQSHPLKADQVAAFVETKLLSPDRRLPIVVVSPELFSEQPSVSPDELATSVLGFANVVKLQDKWAAFKLTDSIGKPLSCYDGAVRMYWPGLARTDDPFSHPLYLQEQIRFREGRGQPLGKHLFRFLTAVSVFRFAEGDVTRSARSAIETARNAEIEELRKNLKAGVLDPTERERALEDAWKDNERLNAELASKQEVLQQREEQIATLTEDLEAQTALWNEYHRSYAQEPQRDIVARAEPEGPIRSVLEAAERASKRFADNLTFLENAFVAAKESPFQRPERVFEALQAIDEVCGEWRKSLGEGKSMGTWREAFLRRGFEYKDDISQTTSAKFGHKYTFVYENQKRLFDKHLTEGAKQPQKCFSVHMYCDETKRKIVIGHVGRHLPNTKA